MKILGDYVAERIHGTLTLELDDGRKAALDIDIDVSDPRSFLELQNHWCENHPHPFGSLSPLCLLSQSFAIHWPMYDRAPQDAAPLTIRVPIGDELEPADGC